MRYVEQDADTNSRRRFDPRLLLWVLSFARGRRIFAGYVVVLIVAGALLSLAGPWITKTIIDNSIRRESEEALLLFVVIYLGFQLFNFLVKYLQIFLMVSLGQRVMKNLRLEVFRHLLHVRKGFFDKNPTGKLMTRVTSDVEAMNELLTSGLVVFVGDLMILVGIVVFLLLVNWKLALATLSLLPLLFVALRIFREKITGLYRNERTIVARLNAFLQESLGGVAVIQLFRRQLYNAQLFSRINTEYFENSVRSVHVYASFFPFVSFLSMASKGIVIWYGGRAVIGRELTLGELVAFLSYVEMFFGPLRDMSEKYNIFQAAMAASEKITGTLSEPQSPEYPAVTASATKPTTIAAAATRASAAAGHRAELMGEIEFRNVWFAYNDENWVLKDVSFRVGAGETVAIVGHTGAGKTTISSLLGRFYEIQRGAILVDGVDLRDWDIAWLRRNLGIVLQDVFLFSGTVRENMTMYADGFDEERLLASVRALQAEHFVARLPQGLSTPVLERGKSLSVGQRQLLSFVRVMLRDPRILILDEATANIDSETERLIEEATVRLTARRSSIVIAHRLSTIRGADRILVLHKGSLKEQGTHAELLERHGLYRDLYELQYREQESSVVLELR